MIRLQRTVSVATILFIFVCSSTYLTCRADDNKLPYYKVPNPFNQPNDGFYSIKSYQTTVSIQRKKTQIEVEEYFSLSEGLSFSLHRNRDKSGQVYAIIGDSSRDKTYIVRNPEAQESIECELDHVHNHKHVFPWQYTYTDEHEGERGSKKMRSIYGVGAIWLNGIQKDITSDQVADDSPYPETNLWQMHEGDLDVKLLFEKPTESGSIASSKLSSIQMRRENVVNTDRGSGATNLINFETEIILISEFQSNIQANDPKLDRFRLHLTHCREATTQHRMFPSLMRALSLSKKRFYGLQYIARKFGGADDTGDGDYNARLLRHTWRNEIVTEMFSFREETQLTMYEGLPEHEEDLGNLESDVADKFIKRLTEDEKSRSSRHATVSYHITDRNGKDVDCKVREDEPLPEDRLMMRPVHFVRPSGKQITGRLTGIGALIMNAADVNYKQFNLFRRKISVSMDAANPYDLEDVTTNEWQFYDKKSGRTYHFYFIDLGQQVHGSGNDIKDLVRIDVRDSKATDTTGEDLIDIERDEDGLIIRYDITSFFTEQRDSRIKLWLTPPKICYNVGPPKDDEDNNDDDDDDSDASSDTEYDFDVSDSEENDDEETNNQLDGEDLEFKPGKMLESFQFPDFFEYLDGQTGYTIESEVELISNNHEPGPRRYFYLRETVDIEKGWTQLSITFPQKKHNILRPIIYYINYNSEVILRLDGKLGACSQVNSVESWLQLFSAEMSYIVTPDEGADDDSAGNLMIESSALRHYGIGALWRHAAESVYSDFVGMKKNTIDGANGRKYREIVWSLADDGDHDMIVHFKFLWDLSQWESDKEKHRHRRTIDMIHLDSIYVADMYGEDEEVGTDFRKYKIQVKSFEKTTSKELDLPTNCRYVLDTINAIAAKEKKSFNGVTIPSILNYLTKANSNSYSTEYTIMHSLHNRSTNGDVHIQQALPVKEYFDGDQNLGKLTVGQGRDTRDVFIDGKKKTILSYLQSSNTCKSIKTLKPLVDLGGAFSDPNQEFNMEKMYGLGALWIQLSKIKRVQLQVTQRHDHAANRYEIRTYEAFQLLAGGTTLSRIRMTFVSRPGAKLTRTIVDLNKSTEEFQLESIEFRSDLHRPVDGADLHKTIIKVNSISGNCPRVWDLPDACKDLTESLVDGDSPDKLAELKFPKVMDQIKATQQFHIRSEVTLVAGEARQRAENNKDPNLFLMDEWLYRKDVRLKTYGLKKNLDLLIYGGSKESFDLSVAYRCPSELPSLDIYTTDSKASNLLQFWNDNTTLIDKLSYLYYSPIALWWLAEKAGSEVKLSNSVEIAPKVMSNSYADYLAKDTRSEVWRYENTKWKIDLFFEKFSRVQSDGRLQEWHVLERIVLDELSEAGKLQIEVINYEWNQKVDQYRDFFLLPEGYGCNRSDEVVTEMRKINDEINLNVDSDLWISYEASLELFDSSGNKTVLPTVSGTYAKSNSISPLTWDDVSAHYSRARNYDGSVVSSKTVYDTDHSIFYRINRLTGECSRAFIPNLQGKDWVIDFPIGGSGGTRSVSMRTGLFRDLFQRTGPMNFKPMNRYTDDNGDLVTVYENSFTNFRILDTTTPPITVVRTFRSPESKIKLRNDGSLTTRLYRSISVKAFVFDNERNKLQAIINIALLRFSNTRLAEIVRLTNVAQCFYDGSTVSDKASQSFTMEYKSNALSKEPGYIHESITHQFIKNLIKYFKVLPTQLNGVPKVYIQDEGEIKVRFNLLEAPTAIEYFRKRPGATMSDEMSMFAEVKLVSPLYECSRWCDSVRCIAMSYCNDRTCRVLTPNMIQGDARRTMGLDSSVQSGQCSFFYRSASPATSLQSLNDRLDAIVNRLSVSEPDKMNLTLVVAGEKVYPQRFYESRSSFEDIDDGSGVLISDSIGGTNAKADEVYKTFKKDHRLNIGKLEEMKNIYPLVVHTDTYSSCLDRCNLMGCSIMSYCKQDTSCVIVSDVTDFKNFEAAIEPSDDLCTVTVRDFTERYTRFSFTSAPKIHEVELANYSVLECAAMCELANGQREDQFNCLSFDSCTTQLKEPRDPDRSEDSVCFLQKLHVMMDDFDRNILDHKYSARNLTDGTTQKITCDHYSKQALYDFNRVTNRQFKETSHLHTLRGLSIDRCAIDCYQDDECTAFQYCFDDRFTPAQTCHLVRKSELSPSDDSSNKTLTSLLTDSKTCSVYTLRHTKEDYGLDEVGKSFSIENLSKLLEENSRPLRYILLPLGYIICALVAGSIIQLAYIKVFGQPVIFD